MTELEAIQARHSVRQYLNKPIEAEKIDQIIEMHTEVVDAIKSERDTAKEDAKKYKADADKLADVEKELNTLKENSDKPDSYKEKYDKIKKEYEDYKTAQVSKETKAAKSKAYREMLKEIGIADKRIERVMKATEPDIDAIELDESGAIKELDELKKKVKEEWSDFIVSEGKKGADTATPPSNTGGSKMTKEQIEGIKDTAARQQAMLENAELFGI